MPRKKKPTGALSVDLAYKRYSDNGIAHIENGNDDVQILKAGELGL